MEDDVGVQRALGAAVDEQQLAGHAQVDHHRVAGVERAQQVLAAAPGGDERGAGEPVDQRLARRPPHRPLPADLDALDAPADDEPLEAAPDRLDLGQLTARSGGRRRRAWRRRQLEHGARASAVASVPWRRAALCSAERFERPSPAPSTVPPTDTVAKKRFS